MVESPFAEGSKLLRPIAILAYEERGHLQNAREDEDEIYSLATTGGTCRLHAFGMDAISRPVPVLAPIRISMG
jgi:hypothetical protein